MFRIFSFVPALTLAGAASAEVIKVGTDKPVTEAADALVAVIEGAGAKVFARVAHGAGAQAVGEDIGASQLVIFGNPKVGTPAMLADRLAGLALPLKVLVYEDTSGSVWFAYEAPAERINAAISGEVSAEITGPMDGALKKLTTTAAQ